MRKKMVKVLAAVSLVFSLQAHAADPVVVCVDAENPPFMSSVGGKAAGLYPALIAEAFMASKLNIQLDAKPWKRCIADMDEARTGVGGIYKNDERLKKYDFSDPIFVEKMAVFSTKGRKFDFSGVASLMGKRVGVMRGWSYGDEFDKAAKEGKITAEEVSSDAQNFQKLSAGRLDAVLAIDEAGATQLKGGAYADVEKSAKYLFENPTFLAFHKSANQADALSKFNKAIDDMRKTGKLGKIATSALSK